MKTLKNKKSADPSGQNWKKKTVRRSAFLL